MKKLIDIIEKIKRQRNRFIIIINKSQYFDSSKAKFIIGYVGLVAIKGDKDLIQLAYDAGIGSHTGIGLGLLEAI